MKYILKANKVWDGISDSYSTSNEVHVKDTNIVKPSKDGEIIDLSGYTLMPGLINSHVHLSLHGDLDIFAAVRRDDHGTTAIKAANNARLSVMNGITTVRDMGSHYNATVDVKALVDSGQIPGPRIVHSGYLICTTGGHGWFFGREADGVDDCRKAAREQLKSGAQWIKVMATGGILTPGVSPECHQLNEDEIRVCVEEAHKANKRSATHAQGLSGVNNALRAGIDTVEHGYYIDKESIDLMIKKGAWLVPTLNAPTSTIESDVPQYVKDKAKRVLDGFIDRFEMAIKAGVKIGAGSDAGTPENWHEAFYMEIVLLSKTSLGNLRALKCATSLNAELLGMEKEIGRIAPGYFADLIAVKGDPIADPSILKNVAWVMKDGVILRSNV